MGKLTQKEKQEIYDEKERKRKIKAIRNFAHHAKQNLRLLNRYWDSLDIDDRLEAAKEWPEGFDFDEHQFWAGEYLDEKGKVIKVHDR